MVSIQALEIMAASMRVKILPLTRHLNLCNKQGMQEKVLILVIIL
jgi:hypothetical protein